MSNPRRKAPASIRSQIVEALRDPGRRFLDPKSSTRNYLDHWDLKAVGFYTDLADGLAASENLFLKPKNHPNDPQRYQCMLAYPEHDPYPALDIHVTLSAKGQPPRVMVAVHESDTVHTLPRIHVDP